jgi:hypothetical protein
MISKTNTLNIATLVESRSKRLRHIRADPSTVTGKFLPPIKGSGKEFKNNRFNDYFHTV